MGILIGIAVVAFIVYVLYSNKKESDLKIAQKEEQLINRKQDDELYFQKKSAFEKEHGIKLILKAKQVDLVGYTGIVRGELDCGNGEVYSYQCKPENLTDFYIWVENTNLCFFPGSSKFKPENVRLFSIPIEKILYYRETGDLITQTTGSGGQSEYSPLTGFHGKTAPISISTKTTDSRHIQMVYLGSSDVQKYINFSSSSLSVLEMLMPQKRYGVHQKHNKDGVKKAETATPDSFSRLKQLQDLFEAKLITEKEYLEKKQQILDNL